ncbi:MAG: hypothetical protein ACK5TE_17560 [Pseudomonadota bacterium]|jgi:hypothetical protein
MNEEPGAPQVNALEWMWMALIVGAAGLVLLSIAVGPQAIGAAGRPGRVVGLLGGGLLALPSLFLYSRWRQWRFGSPPPDPGRPADIQRARSLTLLCVVVGGLPLLAGVAFHQLTGDGTVLMVLAGLSLGIMAAFRPGALFGRE